MPFGHFDIFGATLEPLAAASCDERAAAAVTAPAARPGPSQAAPNAATTHAAVTRRPVRLNINASCGPGKQRDRPTFTATATAAISTTTYPSPGELTMR